MQWKILLFFFTIQLLVYNLNSSVQTISYKDKYSKLLTKGYKADIEYIFDPEVDLEKTSGKESLIRKFFHRYKENELNLYNGARMKCYTPSKVKKVLDERYQNLKDSENKIEKVPEELAAVFLREPSKLCYNSHFKEWFFKLCPTKNANQVLTFKKKDEDSGEEIQESWSLGYKSHDIVGDNSSIKTIAFYQRETNDTSSVNLEKSPYVIVEDRVSISNQKLIY
jgi:hypothetical protein